MVFAANISVKIQGKNFLDCMSLKNTRCLLGETMKLTNVIFVKKSRVQVNTIK